GRGPPARASAGNLELVRVRRPQRVTRVRTGVVTARMLLDGKRILVTGVLNDASIAYSVARRAQEEGAEVVLTSFGRIMSLTRRAARRLPAEASVIELDVADQTHLDALADRVGGTLDGVLHAI